MQAKLEGDTLTLRGVDDKEKFRLIDKAIRQADLLPARIRVEKGEMRIKCHAGSEQRLKKLADILEEK